MTTYDDFLSMNDKLKILQFWAIEVSCIQPEQGFPY